MSLDISQYSPLVMKKLKLLIDVFRPLRWYRNLFMLLGSVLALKILEQTTWTQISTHTNTILLALTSLCLIASGNYGLNEVLDASSDRHHPKKKSRAIPSGRLKPWIVVFLSFIFYAQGLVLAFYTGNIPLFSSVLLLLVSGILYNLRPFRLKDRAYLDFPFEALNNPIRLMVGWYAVANPDQIVPTSIIFGFWFLGIFLMAAKRFGEIRFINNKELAGQYRKSLQYYSEESLLLAMVASIVSFSFLFGSLCVKYSVDLVLLLPLLVGWVLWFMYLAYQENSIVKDPERLFEKKKFLAYSIFTVSMFIFLFFTGNQYLGWLMIK